MPVRLRYLDHDLLVPEGQFVVGRSSTCQLSIDDPMVSRTHAVLVVTGDTATVDDLRSRNGVLVNGERIFAVRQLADGDKLTIGGQQMTVHGLVRATPGKAPRAASTRSTSSFPTAGGIDMLDDPTDQVDLGRFGERSDTELVPARPGALPPDRRVHELSLVGSVAEKAIFLGRPEEAQRIVERPLRDLLSRARAGGQAVSAETAAAAASLAVRLATLLQKGDWVDYVFDLYSVRAELLPQPIVDELYTVLRKLRIDGGRVRTYLEVLRAQPPESFGPTGRFLISRIEGLEPLVGLK